MIEFAAGVVVGLALSKSGRAKIMAAVAWVVSKFKSSTTA